MDIGETQIRETWKGTKYEVSEWTCPICKENKSTLYIDSEICHGDGWGWSRVNGVEREGCTACLLK